MSSTIRLMPKPSAAWLSAYEKMIHGLCPPINIQQHMHLATQSFNNYQLLRHATGSSYRQDIRFALINDYPILFRDTHDKGLIPIHPLCEMGMLEELEVRFSQPRVEPYLKVTAKGSREALLRFDLNDPEGFFRERRQVSGSKKKFDDLRQHVRITYGIEHNPRDWNAFFLSFYDGLDPATVEDIILDGSFDLHRQHLHEYRSGHVCDNGDEETYVGAINFYLVDGTKMATVYVAPEPKQLYWLDIVPNRLALNLYHQHHIGRFAITYMAVLAAKQGMPLNMGLCYGYKEKWKPEISYMPGYVVNDGITVIDC